MAAIAAASYRHGMSTVAAESTGVEVAPEPGPTASRLRWQTALRDIVSGRTWRATAHLVIDLPVGVITFSAMTALLATTFGVLVIFPLALITGALALAFARLFGHLER